MSNPTTQNVYTGGINLMDAVIIAGGSIISRQVLGRLIGTNSWISGAVKVAGALGVSYMVKGKISNYVSASLMIDGATDFANIILNMAGVGVKNGKSNQSVSVI